MNDAIFQGVSLFNGFSQTSCHYSLPCSPQLCICGLLNFSAIVVGANSSTSCK